MPAVVYAVHLRGDSPKSAELKASIKSAPDRLKEEVLFAIGRMERDLVPAKERYELLDGRWETYGLTLGEDPRRLLSDFDVTGGCWTVLALSTGADHRAEAYREACAAHGLINPAREW